MMQKERLTPGEVRRIALGAQGFADRVPETEVTRKHARRVLDRVGLLQIDSVNVVARAHLMPLFSRLGPYPTDLLERAQSRKPRMLFEYWAHEASLLPVETQPLLRWRMERAEAGEGIYKGLAHFGRTKRTFIESIYEEVAARGPLAASAFDGEKGSGGWWGWSDTKRALEWLFWAGRITTHSRRPSFERLYDLPERVLPPSVVDTPTPPVEDAQRGLMAIAARALGVATESDLRDYFRLSPADSKARLGELVEEGAVLPVEIKGWRNQAYLHRDAQMPRRIRRAALLAPFDPVVWERSRAERIFGFHYRIEIYTPAHKRTHGYYVLPFLLGERIVARVDLKADRAGRRLSVRAAHQETGAPQDTAEALAGELRRMATWLGLDDVDVTHKGDLAGKLGAALTSHDTAPERKFHRTRRRA
ncbi:winged helix-turn-helix domain-containing protein [Nitratireductor sp. ZSWI3]|uniref:winged helix-turn-helix domain-containing protein n=1 Tax=Nitratireductor sp. ZSWI3 TaxID=2966359 RepID=UPI0021500509|nr:winged helix-turn-helix domain-containing protein [Nitratireductor sp. ZSWI3]MCR4266009.1 winged helix-turn-helix domain-containing protein [Nitratireductor sp. ZSWI3]